MNVIGLTGNATKDVELRYTTSGTAAAKGTIAVRRNFKDKQTGEYETDFINFAAFGKTAELMADFIKKGDKFGINGALRINKYETDGQKKYFTEVLVTDFDFPDKKKREEGEPYERHQGTTNGEGTLDIDDSDLPF